MILVMNMKRVFNQIDTNERNVFHDSYMNTSRLQGFHCSDIEVAALYPAFCSHQATNPYVIR